MRQFAALIKVIHCVTLLLSFEGQGFTTPADYPDFICPSFKRKEFQ